MVRAIEQILRGEIGVEEGDRILVAVSGGADSVALLHIFSRLAAAYPFDLLAAHLDHALRTESARDAIFVADLCRRLGVPLVMERRDAAAYAKRRRTGIEEGARELRREFLRDIAGRHACRWIALGHHRRDQAETILHRLMRGTSVSGLSGMRRRSGPFIRPLLDLPREKLLDYLRGAGIGWVDDASNRDLRFTRNRIRHHLLPAMREFNPRIEEHLSSLAARIAVEEDFWREEMVRELDRGSLDGDKISLDVARLVALHPALRRRVLRGGIERVRGLAGISAAHLDAIERIVLGDKPQADILIPGGWVGRRYGTLLIGVAPPCVPAGFCLNIPGPGTYPLPDGRELTVRHVEAVSGEGVNFDPSQVHFPLTVRTFSPGDRFFPEGAPGRKKLKDFFIDHKVPREVRRTIPLVVQGEEILWVVGVRRCEGKRGEEGLRMLRLSVSLRQNSDI